MAGKAQVSCSLAGGQASDVVKATFATFNVAKVAFTTPPTRQAAPSATPGTLTVSSVALATY
ncbi:hypothetical protein GCM10027598_74250 [Amycolatopsis oliviviridis]|uniref:Uncharacterized protein n=1 Tax=Amycolatopsis oliviviridis TaxID=1471590 RepID=A0ABQ3L801_9PSEU|nr:hypothetical protein GCM10017790_04190 [Amycolatopsis oliviviridis]